jgi:hypothetical protein
MRRTREVNLELQRHQAEKDRLSAELQAIRETKPSLALQHQREVGSLKEQAEMLKSEIAELKHAMIQKSKQDQLETARTAELQRAITASTKAVEATEQELASTEQNIEHDRAVWEGKNMEAQAHLQALQEQMKAHLEAQAALEQEHHTTLKNWEAEKATLVRDFAAKEQSASRQDHGNLQHLARLKEAASEESQKWLMERQRLRDAFENCSASNASLRAEIDRMEADKQALIHSMSPRVLAQALENHDAFLEELQSGWLQVKDRFEAVVSQIRNALFQVTQDRDEIAYLLQEEESKQDEEKAELQDSLQKKNAELSAMRNELLRIKSETD